MSIRDEINSRVADGRLFHLPSLIPGAGTGRTIFGSKEIDEVARPPWSNDSKGVRHAALRQHLDNFTDGALISVADHPYKKTKNTFMARLDPIDADIFDIRVIDGSKGIRVLGAFADFDVFLVLTYNYRENLDGKRAWRDEIERCKATWRRLFHPYDPHHGEHLNEYISNFFPSSPERR